MRFLRFLHRDPLFVFSLFTWMVLLAGLLVLQVINPLGLLACPVKATVGIPCLTCGMTRMMYHLSTGALYLAFTFQPLGFVSLVGLSLYGPIAYLFDRDGYLFERFKTHAGLIGAGYGGLLILNWFYLLRMGI